MQGEQSNEEKLHLEAKVNQLTEELESKTETHKLLDLQLKRLQVTMLCRNTYLSISRVTV